GVDRDLAVRGGGEELEALEQIREGRDRVLPRQIQRGAGVPEGDVIEGVVDHVLADALLAASQQVDGGRQAVEIAPLGVELAPLELVSLDLQREILDSVVARHGGSHYR